MSTNNIAGGVGTCSKCGRTLPNIVLHEQLCEEIDPWTRQAPITDAALSAIKADAVDELKQFGSETDTFTCDGCSRAKICLLVYDQYNTNGDCLYDK